MKYFIKLNESNYVVDCVTFDPQREKYIGTDTIPPFDVLNGSWKYENEAFALDNYKLSYQEAKAIVIRELGSAYDESDPRVSTLIETRHDGVTLLDQAVGEAVFRANIDEVSKTFTNDQALSVSYALHEWASYEGAKVYKGQCMMFNGYTIRVKQAHTVQSHYPPGIDTASLYDAIVEDRTGTKDDPIPYLGHLFSMVVYKDLFYTMPGDSALYICTRDSINALTDTIPNLIGHYFEVHVEPVPEPEEPEVTEEPTDQVIDAEYPEWIQPTGVQDAYKQGDKVSHNDSKWISAADANVWEPGVHGWDNVQVEENLNLEDTRG